jgi:hypothetical protein
LVAETRTAEFAPSRRAITPSKAGPLEEVELHFAAAGEQLPSEQA